MFGAAKAECNPPPAGTVQLHPALTTIIIILSVSQSVSLCVCVSLCTLVWEGLCMRVGRQFFCVHAPWAPQAWPSAVQQGCVCVLMLLSGELSCLGQSCP